MLAYAADTPGTAGRDRSPKALALILIGHAAVIAAVLTAKPEIIERVMPRRTTIINVPVPPPPKPVPQVDPQPTRPITQPSFIDQERPIIEMEQQSPIQLAAGPTFEDIGTVIGSGPTTVFDPPRHVPVKLAARPTTSENALKPPYPNDKLRAEEEATLRLKLTIDTRGRVVVVDPVGPADPSFLEAARRHILRSWRYKPATEDGVAVSTTAVISLSFRLEDV
jgi:protein TonB